jgi:hypothetical protein
MDCSNKDKKPAAAVGDANVAGSPPIRYQPECDDIDKQRLGGLRKYDVLTGRGSGPNQSQGNTLFRQMVWETYQEYLQSLERKGNILSPQHGFHSRADRDSNIFRRPLDGNAKNLLARQILAKVQEHNGRFLRRICPEDFRNLSEEEQSRVVRVPVEPHLAKAPSKMGSSSEDDEGPASTSARVNLYIELSSKETLEKIKQSLRFQVDRCEQQHNDGLQPSMKSGQSTSLLSLQGPPRKRTVSDASLLQSVASAGMNSPQPPPKKRAVLMGALGSRNDDVPFGLYSNRVATDPSWNFLSMDMAKKLLEAGQSRPLTAMSSNQGSVDFSKWPQLSQLETERLAGAVSFRPRSGSLPTEFTVEQLSKLQNQQFEQAQKQQLPGPWASLTSWKSNGAPSSGPPTPSTLRSTTQLEALSRLLLQEQLDANLAVKLRHQQDLKMASSLLESNHPGRNGAASGPNNNAFNSVLWSHPSVVTSQALLGSFARTGEASREQSLPVDSSGTVIDAINLRASLLGGFGSVRDAGATSSMLRQLYQRVGVQSGALPPSLLSSLLAAANNKHSQNSSGEEGK